MCVYFCVHACIYVCIYTHVCMPIFIVLQLPNHLYVDCLYVICVFVYASVFPLTNHFHCVVLKLSLPV